MNLNGIEVTTLRFNNIVIWTADSGLPYPELPTKDTRKLYVEEEPINEIVDDKPTTEVVVNPPVQVKQPSEGTKAQRAQAIFNEDPNATRSAIIERFMNELNMTKAGASTYHANCKKALTNNQH